MRYSQLVESMMRGVRNDLLGQPFHLLTGLDILGNLSSMVGTLSKGAAALSMDKKFIRSRQRQVCISAESQFAGFLISCRVLADNPSCSMIECGKLVIQVS
jgi:hypothetical protein